MINATVSNATPRAILNLCANRGIDVPKLVSDVGIDKEQLKSASARIPMERVFALWAEAEKLTGDDMISVRVNSIVRRLS